MAWSSSSIKYYSEDFIPAFSIFQLLIYEYSNIYLKILKQKKWWEYLSMLLFHQGLISFFKWILLWPLKSFSVCSVILGTDLPKQTVSFLSDNSNMLHMFKNNTYTDFSTANKHVLIPSYIIRMI